ncbi:MAG: DMT family transporter [Rhodospirillales bacterium]|nr:DMT family transporter [Rhodospirillales bacterium]
MTKAAASITAPPGVMVAYLMLTGTALFWAGNTIVGRAVINDLPPLGLAFWRSFGAFLLIAPFGLPRVWRARDAAIAHWKLLTLLGLLGMTAFSALVFVALHHTTGVNGSLIQGSLPVTLVVLSWIILGNRISRRQAVGVALGFVGLVTIVARGDISVLTDLTFNVGDPILWLGVFCHGLFSILVTRRPAEIDLIALLTIGFFVGSVTTLPLHIWEMANGQMIPFNGTSVLAIAFIALFPSVLAQLFWVEAIQRVGPTTAGYFIYLTPVFGTLMAITLLGEIFAWFHGVGIMLIFGGVYLATVAKSTK